MKAFIYILSFLFCISANGQIKFESIQVDTLLITSTNQNTLNSSDEFYIKAIKAVDKKFRTIVDTLFSYESKQHTILQTIYIKINDSLEINPLSFRERLQTTNILFYSRALDVKVENFAKKLKRKERIKMYQHLSENYDNFSLERKKFKPQPVRIQYIKDDKHSFINVGIDIYGSHFLWTIDTTKNWDVVKCEKLWIY